MRARQVLVRHAKRRRCQDQPVGQLIRAALCRDGIYRQPLMRRLFAARIFGRDAHRPRQGAHNRHAGHVAHRQLVAPGRQTDDQDNRQDCANPVENHAKTTAADLVVSPGTIAKIHIRHFCLTARVAVAHGSF